MVIDRKDNKKKDQNIATTLTGGGHSGGNHSDMDLLKQGMMIRRLTPTECERLQGFPDGWTKYGRDEKKALKDNKGYYTKEIIWNFPILKYIKKTVRHKEPFVQISDTQRYKTLGNAVTVNVIKEIAKRLITNEI